jgi:hypothetical protein
MRLGQVERVTAGRGDLDLVSRVSQLHRHERGDRGLVLDDEDGLRVGGCHRATQDAKTPD